MIASPWSPSRETVLSDVKGEGGARAGDVGGMSADLLGVLEDGI